MRRILIILVLAIIVFMSLTLNDVQYAIGAAKLEFSKQKMIKMKVDHQTRYLTEMDRGEGYKLINKQLAKEGWRFKTQEGSGRFYERDGETLIVTTKMWTGKYILATVHSQN